MPNRRYDEVGVGHGTSVSSTGYQPGHGRDAVPKHFMVQTGGASAVNLNDRRCLILCIFEAGILRDPSSCFKRLCIGFHRRSSKL